MENGKANGWAVGTKLFFVPIRFWETVEPETGHVAEHDVCGRIVPDGDDPNFVYAFHDGYGHNVYMDRSRSFDTREAAIAESERRAAEKKAQDDAEFEAVWSKIMKDYGLD